jgi:hypothetical protein
VKTNRKAGQNIRELALKRRMKGIGSYLIALGIVVFLPFAAKIFQNVMKSLSIPVSDSFPPIVYLASGFMALVLLANGFSLWQKADRASQGAKGEESVARQLHELQQEGWNVEYGMRLGAGLGDADIVCISPKGKAFVIDVKSHRGNVVTDGKTLYRRAGKNRYPFEKNFLRQSMKQALQVKQQKKLSFVTPIVAFSSARVSVPSGKVAGVYVVAADRLVGLLRRVK